MINSFNRFTSKFWPLTLLVYIAALWTLLPFFICGGVMFTGKMTEQEKELAAKKKELEEKLRVLTIGIQGGRGSFNELAVENFMKSLNQDCRLSYLHTTENVLTALEKGEIDRGQFAIRNTLGGEVKESVEAMKKHNFHVICQYNLKVAHTLMMSPNAKLEEIDTVVAHPQALKQCREHLKKYPKLKQIRGEGDLVDPSTWAENLSKGKIGFNHAILGNKALAELNKLKVVEENMQDSDENYTTFLLVKRKD